MSNIGYSVGTMKTCPICKKVYLVPDSSMWVYKRPKPDQYGNTSYFCSWTCLRIYDAKRREKRLAAIEKQREIRAKKRQAQMQDGTEPITEVKAHYTIHRCGKCGKQVAMSSTHCKYCGVKIDWSVYEKEE